MRVFLVFVMLLATLSCGTEKSNKKDLGAAMAPSWSPLIEGVSLSHDVNYKYLPREMLLSNGMLLRADAWNGYLKSYVEEFPLSKREVILEGLSRCFTEYDRIERMIRFEPVRYLSGPYGDRSFVAIKGSLRPKVGANAYLNFLYYGRRYIFAKRVTVVADNFRWDSPALNFARGHYTTVTESALIDIRKPEIRDLIEKIIKSKTAIVRFDSSPTTDFDVTDRMKEDLKAMLAAIDAINSEN